MSPVTRLACSRRPNSAIELCLSGTIAAAVYIWFGEALLVTAAGVADSVTGLDVLPV